ncbi:cytochrome c oxidase subunit 3 [Piscinibacter sp.]|uniref:cytochrome c oxidase subunit 3 n=1 Tax=Piscinibacter sp. TaxID=1903157 RepID=UPI0039E34294
MTSSAALPEPRLSGDLAIWFIVGIEMLTFGLMFIVFSVARLREPALFEAGQATLDLHLGAANTALLLTGSWAAARSVLALRGGALKAGTRWLWGAAALGLAFLVAKSLEYRAKMAAGHDLDSDTFWTLYYLLTGFHFLHVAAAVLFLAGVAWLAPRRGWAGGGHATHVPETAAVFWHMVDLLWVVLFPLVYVLR